MDYRQLGRTGWSVSAIGFGGSAVGIQGYIDGQDRDSEAFRTEAKAALIAALDRGINYFDTAPTYGEGRSERLFGEVLAPVRSRILLGTKFRWTEATTPQQLDEILGGSLERLKTPYVDLLQCHGLNITDEDARRMLSSFLPDWLSGVKARGLARQVGFTAESPSAGVERLLRSGLFATMQVGYNVMSTGACDYRWGPFGVIPLARELGIGVLSMRTSTSGLLQRLFRAEFPELDTRKLTRMAIQFALSTPELDCALVGMQSVADVREAAALLADGAPRYDLTALNRRR
jgi:uncharacterized protein